MIRLTNDNPHDNLSSVLNLFYVKDKSVWVRGGGPGSCLWASEIEEFPIAVTKARFGGGVKNYNPELE